MVVPSGAHASRPPDLEGHLFLCRDIWIKSGGRMEGKRLGKAVAPQHYKKRFEDFSKGRGQGSAFYLHAQV